MHARNIALHRISLGVVALLLTVIAGCGGSSDDDDVGTLRIARAADPSSLDRTKATDNPALWTLQQLEEPLLKVGDDGEPQPWLAEDYTANEDKTEWTFALRPGVTFSNGDPLTADDVKYSLDATTESSAWGFINAPIKSVEARSESDVVISTKSPTPSLPSILSIIANGIVPQDLAGMSEKEFAAAPIGTGPYLLESWDKGQAMKLSRNPEYWGEDGGPENVTYTIVPDEDTRILQLQGGQVDVVENPSPSRIPDLESQDYQFVQSEAVGVFSVLLNARSGPFADTKVRQAMSAAVDREAIVGSLLNGLGDPAASFLPPAVEFYSAYPELYAHDPDKARELLAASEYPNGFKATLMTGAGGGDSLERDIASVLQDTFGQLGIDISITPVDESTAFDQLAGGEFEMATISSTSDIGDPSELSTFYVDPAGEVDQYFTGWLNRSVAEANQRATRSPSDEERANLYAEIQRGVATDAPWLSLFTRPIVYATAPAVEGFSVREDGYIPLTEVSK